MPYGLSIATNTEDILTEINSHAAFAQVDKPNQTHKKYITYDISCNEDFALHDIHEPNTSKIIDRILAIDAFTFAGYDVHVNFSPIIVYDGWLNDYFELFRLMDKYIDIKENVLSECIFLTHNIERHTLNLKNNPQTEVDLWTPNIQETKTSQYGCENIRYNYKLKREYIKEFKQLHDKIIPWNTIRYIF